MRFTLINNNHLNVEHVVKANPAISGVEVNGLDRLSVQRWTYIVNYMLAYREVCVIQM